MNKKALIGIVLIIMIGCASAVGAASTPVPEATPIPVDNDTGEPISATGGCNYVPSEVVEAIWGEPITQRRRFAESEAGGNCSFAVGETDTLQFNYANKVDEPTAIETFIFQAEGFPNAQGVAGVGDEAIWSDDIDMLLVRYGTYVMQATYFANGDTTGQQSNLIRLMEALQQ